MAMKPRYIPADIREDIKLGKVFPIEGLGWVFGVLLLTIVFSILLVSNPLLRILCVTVPTVGTVFIFVFDIPAHINRIVGFKIGRKFKALDDISCITEFGAVSKTKDKKEVVFIEYTPDPWEICPESKKESRAAAFADEAFSLLNDGAELTFYSLCGAESCKHLEERLEKLSELPEKLKDLENARIEHHYRLSKGASSVQYVIKIKKKDGVGELNAFEDRGQVWGGDVVEQFAMTHLTPSAKLQRGEEKGENADVKTA